MKLSKFFLGMLLTLFVSTVAEAWPSCSGHWVSVPKSTTGGTLYNTGDLLFQCQPTDPTTPSQNQSQTQSQNQNQTAKGGNANATGGDASVKNSGNSSNTNKNSNRNTNVSAANSNSSATDNGNNSNNSTYAPTTNIQAPDIPVNTAIGYAPPATVTCFKGYGAGVQTMPVGVSIGGGKIDDNCARLEVARSFAGAGMWEAYCKTMLKNKYVKDAGVTLEDCKRTASPVPQPATPTVVIVPQVTPATIVDPIPPIKESDKVSMLVQQAIPVGECKIVQQNACKAIINDSIYRLRNNPSAKLQILSASETPFITEFLKERGVSINHVRREYSDDMNSTVQFAIVFPEQTEGN